MNQGQAVTAPDAQEREQAGPGAPGRRSIARNSAFGMVGQLLIRALSVLFGIAVVRRFGSDTFGQYASVLAFVSLFSVLSDLGLGAWGVRAVAEDRTRTSALIWRIASLRVVLSLATAVLIIGCAVLLYPMQQVIAIAIATGSLFLFGVNGAFDMAWLGHERLDVSSAISVVNQIAFVVIGTAVLVMHGGVIALIIASLVALAIATAVSWERARRLLAVAPPRPVLRDAWPLVRACAPIGIVQITLLISYKADTVLLSLFRDNATVGIYAVAYNLIFSLMLLSHSVNLALFPALSRAANDHVTLTQLSARAMKYLLAVSVPIAFGGALLAPRLIPLLYTDAFRQSATVLRIVIWVLPLMFLTEFCGYYANAVHRERAAGLAALIMAGVNIACNIVCIPLFGVWAAAIITVITEAVFLVLYLWILRDRSVFRALARLGWRPVLASAGMAAALIALPIRLLPLTIAVGMAVYGGLFLLLRGVTRDEIIAFLPGRVVRPRRATAITVSSEELAYED
jgi:O-antigen/teichoic acid export membrane protein